MTSEERRKYEDRCTIKSKEMFIETCRKNGIPDDWYAFHKDLSKPVYSEGLHVGDTSCLIPMQVWDLMFERLISYKELFDWEHSGEKMKILSISVVSENATVELVEDQPFPFVKLTISSFNPHSRSDGWEYCGFNHYEGVGHYSKVDNLCSHISEIEVEFRKLTDSRDRMTFGFSETSMIGYYKYPTPSELLDEIGREIYEKLSEGKYIGCLNGMKLSNSVRKKMMPFLTEHLLEDEYKVLCEIQRNPLLKDPRRRDRDIPIRTNISQSRGHCVGWYDPGSRGKS